MKFQILAALTALTAFTQMVAATPMAVASEPAEGPKLIPRKWNLFKACDQRCYQSMNVCALRCRGDQGCVNTCNEEAGESFHNCHHTWRTGVLSSPFDVTSQASSIRALSFTVLACQMQNTNKVVQRLFAIVDGSVQRTAESRQELGRWVDSSYHPFKLTTLANGNFQAQVLLLKKGEAYDSVWWDFYSRCTRSI